MDIRDLLFGGDSRVDGIATFTDIDTILRETESTLKGKNAGRKCLSSLKKGQDAKRLARQTIFLKIRKILDATRIGIARELNLSLVKLSSILNGLESKQFIDKVGNVQAKSGRPSYLFQLRPETGCFLEEKQDATGR